VLHGLDFSYINANDLPAVTSLFLEDHIQQERLSFLCLEITILGTMWTAPLPTKRELSIHFLLEENYGQINHAAAKPSTHSLVATPTEVPYRETHSE